MKLMNSRLFAIWLSVGWAALAWVGPAGGQPPRPSVVFFYADDMGYADLGSYGNADARTPHLDRLAADGIRFSQFYVSHCVCSPTRASLITGQYPARQRVNGHFAHLESNARRAMPDWLDVNAPSVPRMLQEAGYRTAVFGKWHLGGGSGGTFGGKAINSPHAPPVAAYGFDADRTLFGNGPTWRLGEPADKPHDIYPYEDAGVHTQSSKFIADASIAFLEDHARLHKTQPFLLHVWFHVPHTPMKPTDEMRAPFRHLPEPRQTYLASLADMDTHIGRVLAKLDALGLRDNTLVLFASDNGGPHNNGSSNLPLRDWKHVLFEGGIRVPLIARWPGRVPAGRVDERSVLNIVDIAPTLLRLAGATPPTAYRSDGIDIADALFGNPIERSTPMFWYHPTSQPKCPPLAMRRGDWKLLTGPDGAGAMLFNLAEDVGERTDLTASNPQVVTSMRAELNAWLKTLPSPRQ